MTNRSLKEWVNQWKRTGPLLKQQRDEEIRQSVPSEAIEILDDAYEYALIRNQPSSTSGFVEYYKILLKGKK